MKLYKEFQFEVAVVGGGLTGLCAAICDTVRLRFTKTRGDPCVKVFEVRIY